jgi:hypothetical protein
MLALDKAEGINIGSVMIDSHARQVMRWLAEDMMDRSGFERYKCNYDGGDIRLDHYLDIPRGQTSSGPSPPVVFKS